MGCQPVTEHCNIPCLTANNIPQAFPVRYGSPRDIIPASSSFVHLHTLGIEEKKETAALVGNGIVHKQGSLQRFKLIKRLQFSAFSRSVACIKISPESHRPNLNIQMLGCFGSHIIGLFITHG
jgi:hypothetical protein